MRYLLTPCSRAIVFSVFTFSMAAVPAAQSPPRLSVGPVAVYEGVRFFAQTSGSHQAAGIGLRLRVGPRLDLEGDITVARGSVHRSLESLFVSFAPPGSSPQELERLAPVLRQDRSYEPGIGGSTALAFHVDRSGRVGFVVRGGVAIRRYVDRSDMTVVTLPPGLTLEQVERTVPDEVRHRARAGLMVGVGWPIAITDRLSIEPAIRYVWNGPARINRTYRATRLGVTATWGW